jgi:uncharacterized protein (DUF427 family)
MKIPGPEHPITVTPTGRRVTVRVDGVTVADTTDALTLQESTYPPVYYLPLADVEQSLLRRTEHTTHCPYKGDASYYTLLMDGHFAENAVWTYETPYPAMTAIANHVAFYPNHVELYEVDDAAVNPHHVDAKVDQAVLHTDAGDGTTQREHWPANVNTPGIEGGVR